MKLPWTGWLVLLCALNVGGFFLVDGVHAFLTGDYITPESGEYGPWSKVVAAVGIEPGSTAMQAIFVAYGAVWLAVMAGFIAGAKWSWKGMLLCALGSLWYLPFGTVLGVIQVGLLMTPRLRARADGT